jgi:hypothetical protein
MLVELRVRPRRAELPVAEPVVRAAVHVVQERRTIVRQVAGEPVRAVAERDLLAVRHADARALRAGKSSEQVVERPILEHQVDDPLDRPSRLAPDDRRRLGQRATRRLRAAARARVQRRACEREAAVPQEPPA